MERKIYLYVCMECDFEWESTFKDETICHMCGCGDLHVEESETDEFDEQTNN